MCNMKSKFIVGLLLCVVLAAGCRPYIEIHWQEVEMETKNIVAYKDTSAASETPSSAYYGTHTKIPCGVNNTGSVVRRAYMGFPISEIPSGAVITGATLYLYQDDDISFFADLVFDLYRVTDAWTEAGLTWNNQPAVEASPTITSLVCASSESNVWRSYDITTLFQEMFSTGSDSIMMRAQNESTVNSGREFFTREWSTSYCAYIAVEYTVPIKIAASTGSIDKTVTSIMIAPDYGPIDKEVVGMQVYDGSAWKTAF